MLAVLFAILNLFFNLFFYAMTLILAIIGVIGALLPARISRAIVQGVFVSWCHGTMFLVRWVLWTRIDVENPERIAEGAPLLVSKHQSECDVALIGVYAPRYAAIAMRELDNYPLLGRIIGHLGHVKVSVSGERKNQLPEVLEGMRRVHGEKRPILIYPEGTLMSIGRQERYRGGVWYVYKDLNIPVTPIAHDLGVAWPRREWRKNFGTRTAMKVLEPIPPGLDRLTFMKELERRIETETNALIKRHLPPAQLADVTFDYEEKQRAAPAAKLDPTTEAADA